MATMTAQATVKDQNGSGLPDGSTISFSYLPQNAPAGTTPTAMPSGTTTAGVATSSVAAPPAGTYVVTATWAGNASYLASSGQSGPVPVGLSTSVVVVVTVA